MLDTLVVIHSRVLPALYALNVSEDLLYLEYYPVASRHYRLMTIITLTEGGLKCRTLSVRSVLGAVIHRHLETASNPHSCTSRHSRY